MSADRDHFIYFVKPIDMVGPIKIGLSWRPTSRLESLMTWSPIPLEILVEIPGDKALETNIHDCFGDLYLRREWFTADARLLAVVEKLQRGLPIFAAMDLSDRRRDLRADLYAKRGATRRRSTAALKAEIAATSIRGGAS